MSGFLIQKSNKGGEPGVTKLSDKQRIKIIAEYISGTTQHRLAEKYNVSQQSISKILAAHECSKNLLQEKADEVLADTALELENFLRSRTTSTNEIIELTQKMIKEKLKAGKISPKEAVGACKVFSELIMTANEKKKDNGQQSAASDFTKALLTAAKEINNAGTDFETI